MAVRISHFSISIFHRSFLSSGSYQTLAFCRFAAQAIWGLSPNGGSADSTIGVLGLTKVRLAQIGKLFPDNILSVLRPNANSLPNYRIW
jgi:hypothetical protein